MGAVRRRVASFHSLGIGCRVVRMGEGVWSSRPLSALDRMVISAPDYWRGVRAPPERTDGSTPGSTPADRG
jgi:hypothetical protein